MDDISPAASAAELLRLLGERSWTLAVAESLTGGAIGAEITSVAGASEVFRGGIICYATDLKASLVGVDPALLAASGPVDAQVARQLARGVAARTGADCAIAVTGVAGPGPSADGPAGLVYIAALTPGSQVVSEYRFGGDRAAVRGETVRAAIGQLAALVGPQAQ